jgi:hypothetical protein
MKFVAAKFSGKEKPDKKSFANCLHGMIHDANNLIYEWGTKVSFSERNDEDKRQNFL